MANFLTSEDGLELTRASISHFEAFYEIKEISQKRLISPEMISALTQDGPNSSKIHSTLSH
eukprot:3813237-Amphidinium_carterae.1